jgi:cyclic lactone autoinducer peptide
MKKILLLVAFLLTLIAQTAAVSACTGWWYEPDMPESLK